MRGFTADKKDKIRQRYLAALRQGLGLQEAARAAGVSRDKIWRWRRDEPEFVDQCDQAEADGLAPIENVLRQKALAGHYPSITFILERRGRTRWYLQTKGTTVVVQAEAPSDIELAREELLKRLDALTQPKTLPVPSRNGHHETKPR